MALAAMMTAVSVMPAKAASEDVIDTSKTASLTIHKYDKMCIRDRVESSRGVVWSNIYKKAKELIYKKEKFVSGIRLLEQEPENALALYCLLYTS